MRDYHDEMKIPVQNYENGVREVFETETNIESNQDKKIKYPKRVWFIIGDEFCERFNFTGMATILVLYLKFNLGYTEDDATLLYHGFTMMVYFMCIFGGILSDVWLGKFKTILYLSIIYSIGSILVAVSSIPDLNLSPKIVLIVGLVFIAIGSGGIKPCVCAFGGDQFKLPEQSQQFASYFSFFFFGITAGSIISAVLTPMLRADVQCFGNEDCFPLAFGLPAVLMIISIVILWCGKSSYTYIKTSSENMLIQVSKCVMHSISSRIRDGRTNPHKKLLDYSIDKYGQQLVSDIRALLQILMLFLSVPLFWTLNNQIGSRWTFQATRMNGDIVFYIIKPDQMHMLHSLFVLILLPVFDIIIHPFLYRFGIRRPFQKMVIGGISTAVSFLMAAVLQFQIESSSEIAVHMLWQLPQYVAMAVGEVMFSVTGMTFSYKEAPASMKSVVMAFWFINIAVGNLIIMFITKLSLFDSQMHEFIFFSGLLFVDMLVFIVLAYHFKSSNPNDVGYKKNTNEID